MKKFFLALLILVFLFLLSCDSQMDKVDDRFKYESGQSFQIRIHIFKTHDELTKYVKSVSGDKEKPDLWGWSQMSVSPVTGKVIRCDIYVKDSDGNAELETWGHELKHCIRGNWHSE